MEQAPDWILVGEVRRPHGTGGEVLVKEHSDFEGRFAEGARLFAGSGDQRRPVKVASRRRAAKGLLVRFAGYDSRDRARELTGKLLFIPGDELAALPPGSYYAFQLEGCSVHAGGERLGVVRELLETAANPVLVVEREGDGGIVCLPFVSPVVTGVDLHRRRIDIVPGFLG